MAVFFFTRFISLRVNAWGTNVHRTQISWSFVPQPGLHHHVNLPVFTRNLSKMIGPSLGRLDGSTSWFPRILCLSQENLGQSHITCSPVSSLKPQVQSGSFGNLIFVRCLFNPQCPVIALITLLIWQRSMTNSSRDHFPSGFPKKLFVCTPPEYANQDLSCSDLIQSFKAALHSDWGIGTNGSGAYISETRWQYTYQMEMYYN